MCFEGFLPRVQALNYVKGVFKFFIVTCVYHVRLIESFVGVWQQVV